MRPFFVIATALGLLVSCNNADTTKISSSSTIANLQGDTISGKTRRQLIIEELKRMQAAVASEDKERIADIFQFPLPEASIGIYIDDSAYHAQLEANENMITRTMFLRFFPQISESLQVNELNQLFNNIRLANLEHKDTLASEVHIKQEPCYKFYGIEVQGDTVTLSTGQGVNQQFKTSKTSGDEVPENSSEFCESILWWNFRFDGKRLNFIKQYGAG